MIDSPVSPCGWLGVQQEDAMGDRDVDWLDQLCEADEKIAELETENAKLRDQLRWRDAHTEPPKSEGRYIVAICRKSFGSWSDNYWENGRWEIEPVDYWRPIGSLPGGE